MEVEDSGTMVEKGSTLSVKDLLDLMNKSPRGYGSILIHHHEDFCKYLKTKYLTNNLGEAIYLYINKDKKKLCKYCAVQTKFKEYSHGYFDFCSSSCRAKYNKSHLNGITKTAVEKRKHWRDSLSEEDKQNLYNKRKKLNKKQLQASKNKSFITIHGDELANKLKDYNLLYNKYIVQKLTAIQIAVELNTTIDTIYNALNRLNIKREVNIGTSNIEKSLVEYIKSLGINNIIENTKKLISPYEVDIYLPDHKLAIEFCGCYWHSDSNKLVNKTYKYHQDKFLKLKELGIKLITIFDIDWIHKSNIIKSRINNLLQQNVNKIFARKCIIKIVSTEHIQFLNENHLAGHTASTINLGLYFENKLVSIMTFKKPRYNKKYEWELIRFCSLLNTTVIGAANKLFKYFINSYKPTSIISYSDNCWGESNLYSNLGFNFKAITRPSYFYFKPKEIYNTNSKKYHRSNFTKNKIINKMNGNKNLTEKENMKNLGYYRVWDCGTTSWEWHNL